MTGLTDLPLEIFQLIAGKCSAVDILSLSRTCRSLHVACDEATVFQSSLESHLPQLTSAAFQDSQALLRFMRPLIDGPQDPPERDGESSARVWLCLAVAMDRISMAACELDRLASSVKVHATFESQQLGQDTKEALQGVIGFLATLPVWGYARICSTSIAATLESLCPIFFSERPAMQYLRIDRSLGGKGPLQFAFCLALSSLSKDSSWPGGSEDGSNNSILPFGPDTGSLFTIVKAAFEGEGLGPGYREFKDSWISRQTHAALLLVIIARHIRDDPQRRYSSGVLSRVFGIAQPPAPPRERPRLPDPKKIAYIPSWYYDEPEEIEHQEETDRPSSTDGTRRVRFPLLTPSLATIHGNVSDKGRYFYPFAGDDWLAWYSMRVRDLANRLDEGQWAGCYTYGLSPRGRIDPPMERIRFQKTDVDGSNYSIEATDCYDGLGAFSLRGQVNVTDSAGTVLLHKSYVGMHSFVWQGWVTPLGICGTYRAPGQPLHYALGFFWLWKKEWADGMGMVI
ncbi:hypothetical protein F4778DRAFT_73315 [Xylariomycetidae sp. FL2044]|nr:hypothetical protein F4778DRAFT_73315 [Xylariomycetidae sp. FL2044]